MEKDSNKGLQDVPMVNRNYKDTLFRCVFKEKENLLSLYNAVNGTNYEDPNQLEIVTLENAVYMNMKNDLAFIMDFYLNLYEHQSTFSPNMPLRDLFYISKELQTKIKTEDLYSSKLVKIPTPQFIVFYNGTENQPERQLLRLSDTFQQKQEEPDLELKVTMLNVNLGNNQQLLNRCKLLKEYMLYVDRVRRYAKEMELNDAVELAVNECIKENILIDFLTKYRKEAIEVSIFEYNEELTINKIKEDEYDRGVQEGDAKQLITQVCNLLSKGYELDQIQDLLVGEKNYFEAIVSVAADFAPEYDVDAIYQKMTSTK